MFTLEQYKKKYKESLENPEKFWDEVANKNILWKKKWDKVLFGDYPNINWFSGAELNITESCLDGHIKNGNGEKIAYHEVNENDAARKITYKELLSEVCKLSNALIDLGIKKSDTVIIYMPTCIEEIVSILACARIGAIHSVVFAGLSAKALEERILDTKAKIVITADGFERRGKYYSSINVVREATRNTKRVSLTIVLKRFENQKTVLGKNELDYRDLIKNKSSKWPSPQISYTNLV